MLVRKALVSDLAYMDWLQSKNTNELGFMTRETLEVFVVCERVFIGFENDAPAGYVLGRGAQPKHLARGHIVQACVQYDLRHRALGHALVDSFIGSLEPSCDHLVLWCAQDLEANEFWQSQGFEAVAWRLGKQSKGRVHLLWHRSLWGVDRPSTFVRPAVTSLGMMNGPRIVVPLQPGQSWRDVKPEQRHDVIVHAWGEKKERKRPTRRAKPEPVPRVPMLIGGRVALRPKSLYTGYGSMT